MAKIKLTLVDAIYINNSGGKVLLDYLINTIIEKKLSIFFYFLLDSRGEYNYLDEIDYEFLNSSERSRYQFYKGNQNRFSKVLCFGNVPPSMKLKANVYVYFHNVLLAESLKEYPLKNKLLKYLKRSFIRYFMKNVDEVFVQTSYVKELFKKKINNKVKVSVLPFYSLFEREKGKKTEEFVYVSNGNPHKNHSFLLDVWKELGELKLYPVLNLTITEDYQSLIERIDSLKVIGIKINNHGFTSVSNLFAHSNYLIYPSLKESFGLGLVEAVHGELKVIGADLPYTYEVVKPSLRFNPKDVNSLVLQLIKVINKEINLERSEIIVDDKINELIEKVLN